MKSIILLFFLISLGSCGTNQKKDHQIIAVKRTAELPVINGLADDKCWQDASWLPIDQRWLGESYSDTDFKGRYKLAWSPASLYLLVEIIDDTLYDQRKDPLKFWWDDDCVEVFVDEDNSGGEHQFNHNAFAYHVALDGNVVDMATDKNPRLYNDHVQSARVTVHHKSIWELSIRLFDDSFQDGKENLAVALRDGKKIGFALAYCDNDASKVRENFIGSVFVPGEDKNQGWINADVFGTLLLLE